MTTIYDVAIVGAGPAGMTAGIYASRAMLKTVMIEKGVAGGLMAVTDKLDNWPGTFSVSGAELSEKMLKQATGFGCEFKVGEVLKIVKSKEGTFSLNLLDDEDITAKTVIYAAGSTPRFAEIEGEKEFIGRGVSYCALCDAAFYRGLKVAVLGGGDSALKEALFLTKFADEVTIVHRRQEFRAEKIIQEEVRENQKIKFALDSVAVKIEGSHFVEKVSIKNVKSGEISTLNVDGVFVFLGYVPKVEPIKGLIELAEDGRIKTDSNMKTNVEGFFAAGDIVHKLVNQVATAVGDGATAAVAAEQFISSK
ncbi:MAG: thioredoxin-disulfide reductase [bacterium]